MADFKLPRETDSTADATGKEVSDHEEEKKENGKPKKKKGKK